MPFLALGFVLLLGLLIGSAGMRRVGRLARRTWRPGAGFMALAAFIAAAILLVRGELPVAAVLAFAGFLLSLGARRRAGRVPPPLVARPDVREAASILGVDPDASDEEVQAAYLRLIRRAHPDSGGTAGLAAQLNAARETMLRRGDRS